ncbi:FtsK/SpoIIIE family protein [Corynebacterium amycolatum]
MLLRRSWGSISLTDTGAPLWWAQDEDGHLVCFDPYASYHTFIAGITRSGKSKGSQSILIQLAKHSDIQVVGIDPAFGLLRPWWEYSGRPQDFVLGTSEASLKAAIALVNAVVAEMESRMANLGRREKIDDFSVSQPIIFCVLEEYSGLIESMTAWDKKQAASFTGAVGRLLREGAKVGIRVFTILQRAEAKTLHDRSQYGRRISYAQDNTDSIKMMFDQVEPEVVARMIALQPGRGVLREIGKPDFTWFQSPDMDYDEYYDRIGRYVFDQHTPLVGESDE